MRAVVGLVAPPAVGNGRGLARGDGTPPPTRDCRLDGLCGCECSEGEGESVDALNGCTGLSTGRRIGNPTAGSGCGEEGKSGPPADEPWVPMPPGRLGRCEVGLLELGPDPLCLRIRAATLVLPTLPPSDSEPAPAPVTDGGRLTPIPGRGRFAFPPLGLRLNARWRRFRLGCCGREVVRPCACMGTITEAAGDVYGEGDGVAVGEGRTNRSARAATDGCPPTTVCFCFIVASLVSVLVEMDAGLEGYRTTGLVPTFVGGPGGERGSDVRAGKLPLLAPPPALTIESRCWFFTSVGVNPLSPPPLPIMSISISASADKKRSLSRLSSSSSAKFGVVRYRRESARLPIGCGIEGKAWVEVGSDAEDAGVRVRVGGVSEDARLD